jgi:ABC-type transport auxiliary lipoprotein component
MKAVSLLALTTACALTAKSSPVHVRYFAPEISAQRPAAPCSRVIHVGKVSSSAHLRYRMVRRRSPVELEVIDSTRWTEYPEAYLKRSFERRLGVQQNDSESTTVSLALLAFDDVERGAQHFARIEVEYEVTDDERPLARGVVAEERAATGADPRSVVEAMTRTLEATTNSLTERTVRAMNCH